METSSLVGKILVADLDLQDSNFYKSVILIVDHNDDGAIGLVLNRPLGMSVDQLFSNELTDSLPEIKQKTSEISIYGGGPVEPRVVFSLYSGDASRRLSASEREIIPGVYFEPSFSFIHEYVVNKTETFPQSSIFRMKLFLGYSGWQKGQLENEIEQGAWHIASPKAAWIFHTPAKDIWEKALGSLGGLWKIVAQTGFKPSLN